MKHVNFLCKIKPIDNMSVNDKKYLEFVLAKYMFGMNKKTWLRYIRGDKI